MSDKPLNQWGGIETDDDGRVTVLHAFINNLTGSIPPEIGGLTKMRRLSFADNKLSGSIPTEFGNLSSLDTLNINENELSGSIPSSFGNLTSLVWVDMGNNKLGGQIPHQFGELSNLKRVYLANGAIPGRPDPGPNLYTGCVPWKLLRVGIGVSAEGDNIPGNDLDELGLPPCASAETETPTPTATPSGNSGSAPGHTATTPVCESRTTKTGDREILEVLYCATDGDNWKNSSNWMSEQPLSKWRGVKTKGEGRVSELRLHSNNLIGTIPSQLGDLSDLTALSFSANRLSGQIPTELSSLSNLTLLHLSYNRLSEQIPAELGSLTNLEELFLIGNRLSGQIPTELGSLTKLRKMYVSGNRFTGCIPAALRNVDDADFGRLGLPFCAATMTTTPTPAAVATPAPISISAPTANAGADFNGKRGEVLVLSGSGTAHSEGSQALTYSWRISGASHTELAGAGGFLVGASSAQAAFTVPRRKDMTDRGALDDGNWIDFELTVTDGDGDSSSDTVRMTIQGTTWKPG